MNPRIGYDPMKDLTHVGYIAGSPILFIVSAKFTAILAALAFFFVANYSMAYISVIVLRRREPDLPRPYRVWGYPWTTLLVLLGSIAFLVGAIISDKKNSLVALAILAASVPMYLISKLFSPRGSA